MSAATEKTLGLLHSLMADQFMKLLKGELTRPRFNADGDHVGDEVLTATAAELAVIRAFLKDNEITAVGDPGSALDKLREQLKNAGTANRTLNTQDFDLPGALQ